MGHYSHSDIEEAVKSAKKEGLKDYLYQEPHGKKRSHKIVAQFEILLLKIC